MDCDLKSLAYGFNFCPATIPRRPYYMGMDDEEGQFRFELAYPTTFFAALADRALHNLRRHLEANDIDPYGEFGTI